MSPIVNDEEYLYSRDIIARIETLEDEGFIEEGEREELASLKKLAAQCEGYRGWADGAQLIADGAFEDYVQQLAEDCCDMKSAVKWPFTCVDWAQAARELQQEYMSVDFAGETYWMRS